jgi:hypothetical protein
LSNPGWVGWYEEAFAGVGLVYGTWALSGLDLFREIVMLFEMWMESVGLDVLVVTAGA